SYKYHVTKDPETLDLIGRMLDGFHFAIEVTGQRGLAARCVLKSDVPVGNATERYVAADGTVYHYRSDAAKGTYNQLVGGYAVLMMHAYDALPPEKQRLARNDLQALAHHLVYFDYRLTERNDEPTSYGNLTPLIATHGVPFNAQVAYTIVAAGHHFPGDEPTMQERINEEFERLRDKHHVYYEDPARYFICPQRVGDNPLVKGMNDRNHVANAAFVGLLIEMDSAKRKRRPVDGEFLYQLGRTIHWTMERIQYEGNALCNFQWAAVHQEPEHFRLISPHDPERRRKQLEYLVATGMEQLRRCPLDRFYVPGEKIETREPHWVDAQRPGESYYWKHDPYYYW
ncbi:MAG: hypothetical protein ACREIV_16420, partial [Planctomycetaceae bacterium]